MEYVIQEEGLRWSVTETRGPLGSDRRAFVSQPSFSISMTLPAFFLFPSSLMTLIVPIA